MEVGEFVPMLVLFPATSAHIVVPACRSGEFRCKEFQLAGAGSASSSEFRRGAWTWTDPLPGAATVEGLVVAIPHPRGPL